MLIIIYYYYIYNNSDLSLKSRFLVPSNKRLDYAIIFNAIQSGSGGNPGEIPIPCIISNIQHSIGIIGAVGEIGVFYGRFFMALAINAYR